MGGKGAGHNFGTVNSECSRYRKRRDSGWAVSWSRASGVLLASVTVSAPGTEDVAPAILKTVALRRKGSFVEQGAVRVPGAENGG